MVAMNCQGKYLSKASKRLIAFSLYIFCQFMHYLGNDQCSWSHIQAHWLTKTHTKKFESCKYNKDYWSTFDKKILFQSFHLKKKLFIQLPFLCNCEIY